MRSAITQIQYRIQQFDRRVLRRHDWLTPVLPIMVIASVVFFPFLINRWWFIFTDIGSDSLFQFWPLLTHIAEHLRTDGILTWTFSAGLGQDLFSRFQTDPFNWPLFLAGPERLSPLIGYMHVAKVLAAGIVFYLYLRTVGLGRYSATIGSLLYAFSGHMLVRGSWYHYATEAVSLALLLLAIERYLVKSDGRLIPLAVLGIVMKGTAGAFYLFHYGMVAGIYISGRFLMRHGSDVRRYVKTTLIFAGWYLLGIAISAITVLPATYNLLQSSRTFGGDSMFWQLLQSNPFTLNELPVLINSVLTAVSVTALGVGNDFSGVGNYLEAPLYYAGALTLLLVPLSGCMIRGMSRPERLGTAVLGGAVLGYVFMPYLRFVLNGFSGEYFKISSLWTTAVMILLAMMVLNRLIRHRSSTDSPDVSGVSDLSDVSDLSEKRSENLRGDWLLLGSAGIWGIVITIAMLLAPLYGFEVSVGQIFWGLFLLFAFGIMVIGMLRGFSHQMVLAGILGLVMIELMIGGALSTLGRTTLIPRYQEAGSFGRGYYDDHSLALISQIKNEDPEWYRIGRTFQSEHLNDPLMQGYAGTTSYQSFNHSGYAALIHELRFENEFHPHLPLYIGGFADDPRLEALVGVRYRLSRDPDLFPERHQLIASQGDVFLFRDQHEVPLGTMFYGAVSDQFYEQAPALVKRSLLANTLILPQPYENGGQRRTFPPGITETVMASTGPSMEIVTDRATEITGQIDVDRAGMLFLSIPYDSRWQATVNGLPVELKKVSRAFMGIPLEPGRYEIELWYSHHLFAWGGVITIAGLTGYAVLLRRLTRRSREPQILR